MYPDKKAISQARNYYNDALKQSGIKEKQQIQNHNSQIN